MWFAIRTLTALASLQQVVVVAEVLLSLVLQDLDQADDRSYTEEAADIFSQGLGKWAIIGGARDTVRSDHKDDVKEAGKWYCRFFKLEGIRLKMFVTRILPVQFQWISKFKLSFLPS